MTDPGALGLARGMEGIPQADQARDCRLVGDQAGDAPAHRLAPDEQPPARSPRPAQVVHDGVPAGDQRRLPVRRPPLAVLAAPGHVRKFEPRDPYAGRADPLGERGHEGAVHRCASAVREDRAIAGVGRAVEQDFGHPFPSGVEEAPGHLSRTF